MQSPHINTEPSAERTEFSSSRYPRAQRRKSPGGQGQGEKQYDELSPHGISPTK